MEIYIYNKSFTEQSIRQMETIMSNVGNDLVLPKEWESFYSDREDIFFCDFKIYIRKRNKVQVMFLNIKDGLKVLLYKRKYNLKLIFRPRGITPEESYFKHKNRFKKCILNVLENMVIKETDTFVFLNEVQRAHFLSKYQELSLDRKDIYILPNVKTKMNIHNVKQNNFVKLVYSGGFSKWQNIESVFEMASNIISSNSYCTFTVLTFKENFSKARELQEYYKIASSNFEVKYIETGKIDVELQNYDVGIVIRTNDIVNIAASPFKIIDYISNGLGIIVTENLYSQINKFILKKFCLTVTYNSNKIKYSADDMKKFIDVIEKTEKKLRIDYYNSYIGNMEKLYFHY